MNTVEFVSAIMMRFSTAKAALENDNPELALQTLEEIEKLQRQLEKVALNGHNPFANQEIEN